MPSANSIWTRPERGARGPQPERSRDEIARTAVGLADADGLPAATMRAVAAALGTGGGALYRYLSSRDDLLDLMLDTALAELPAAPTPPDVDWLDGLVARATDLLDLHRRHPWLLAVDLPGRALGPHALDHFDRCLALLAPLEVPTATKLEAIALITGVVVLFARSATTRAAVPPAQLFTAAGAERHPHLHAALTRPVPAPTGGEELFLRTLRSLLCGLLTSN